MWAKVKSYAAAASVLAIIAVGAMACGAKMSEADEPKQYRKLVPLDGNGMYVWRDPETGCQYLYTRVNSGGVMIPRLKEGRPMCSVNGE